MMRRTQPDTSLAPAGSSPSPATSSPASSAASWPCEMTDRWTGAAASVIIISDTVCEVQPVLVARVAQARQQALTDPCCLLCCSLQELIRWLFAEPNPIGVNTAMAMCGLIQPVFRCEQI